MKRTNKDALVKGIKTMAISAFLMFAGPSLLYFILQDKEQMVFIPLLIIGFLICALAIYMGFKGIKIIMDSMFKPEK